MKMRKLAFLLVFTLVLSLMVPTMASASGTATDWKGWSQSDARWGSLSISSRGYSERSMAREGCLVTAIAKVLIHSGQQDPRTFTPAECLAAMHKYDLLNAGGSLYSGIRMNTEGFLATLGPELVYSADSPMHSAWSRSTAASRLSALIKENCYVIIRAYNYTTGNHHYMAVDRVEDGRVYVMDNNGVIDLYACGKYGGVAGHLCFHYQGEVSYPVSDTLVFENPGDASQAEAADPQLLNFYPRLTYRDGVFSDVTQDDWFRNDIARCYEIGLFTGNSDGTFGVDKDFTVASALTLAARIHSTYYNGSSNFQQGTPWYGVYVDYCIEQGIIEDGQFDSYERPCTRSELACLFSAALPDSALALVNDVPYNSIPDVDVCEDFCSAVYRLYQAGILTGDGGNHSFRPDDFIDREEVACMAARVSDPCLRKLFTMENS